MTAKQTKAKLLNGAKRLDKKGLRYMLGFGILLALIRDKKITSQPDVDVMILAEDITPELEKEFRLRDYVVASTREKYGHVTIRSGFDIFVLHKKGNKRYINTRGEICLVWPAYHFEEPEELKYANKKWRIPKNPEKWLETYYGDWKTPNLDWNWETNAKNKCKLEDVDKFKIK